jgi:hypothetical protein
MPSVTDFKKVLKATGIKMTKEQQEMVPDLMKVIGMMRKVTEDEKERKGGKSSWTAGTTGLASFFAGDTTSPDESCKMMGAKGVKPQSWIESCGIVLSPERMDKSKSCYQLSLGETEVMTGMQGMAMNEVAPFFTLPENWQFVDDYGAAPKKYDAAVAAHGCSVILNTPVKTGETIGLVGVKAATNIGGVLPLTTQLTPWLGSVLNHCKHPTGKVVLKQKPGEPDQEWLVASRDMKAGEEVTVDYSTFHADKDGDSPESLALGPAQWAKYKC